MASSSAAEWRNRPRARHKPNAITSDCPYRPICGRKSIGYEPASVGTRPKPASSAMPSAHTSLLPGTNSHQLRNSYDIWDVPGRAQTASFVLLSAGWRNYRLTRRQPKPWRLSALWTLLCRSPGWQMALRCVCSPPCGRRVRPLVLVRWWGVWLESHSDRLSSWSCRNRM